MYSRFLFLFLICFSFATTSLSAQQLYQESYGNDNAPALIFLHGGPGYNSAGFEIGAAEALAAHGYRVVVYDRRGTARSKVKKAAYTFEEASKDLKKVMKQQGLQKATLLGHSFGGAVAIRFAREYPEMVENIVLIGAPLDYPATFVSIRNACREVYTAKGDTANLHYMDLIDEMDATSLEYSSYCFVHAMSCGLYSPETPTEQAQAIYQSMMQDERGAFLMASKRKPVQGFYDAHQYTSMDFSSELKAIVSRTRVFGIYGLEDGLFDAASRAAISGIVGSEHFHAVEGASHNVFLDQRERFFELLDRCLNQSAR